MEKKIILIIGKADSGKTTKAKEIANSYDKKNVTWIDGYNYNKGHCTAFFYRSCNSNTELIIIDGIRDASYIEHFFGCVTDGVSVEKIYKDPFCIFPRIILICESYITLKDLPVNSIAFNRRVSIIKM